jgi:2-aminoadipate transaminase
MRYDAIRAHQDYGRRGHAIVGSAIDATLSTLAALDRPIVSLAMGSPAPDAIPTSELAALADEVLRGSAGSNALDYAPTEGHPELRLALLDRLDGEGFEVDPDCVLVTAGGMQGLDLSMKLFLDPGDLVFAESPSYTNGLATAHNYEARVVQVGMDDEGMDLDMARAEVARRGRPRLIYSIPTFQNPSGLSYSRRRRGELLAFAEECGAIVIEDDPYGELRYEGDPIPSLLELDEGRGHVIQVRTFSKIVAPGLRLGWLVGPKEVVARAVAARQSMDTCANALSQRIIARFISRGLLDHHIRNLRELYPARRDAMIGALQDDLGGTPGVRWRRPEGGMFLWLELPTGVDGTSLLAECLRQGVAVVPGIAFDPARHHAIRLCFSAVTSEEIPIAISRLAAAVHRLRQTPSPEGPRSRLPGRMTDDAVRPAVSGPAVPESRTEED